MNRFAAACLLSALSIFPGIAHAADAQGNAVMQKWKASDKCARQAQAAFPDFTPDANARRDARLRECLEGGRLPPRELSTPGH
jgi:hypothetical protein